MERAGGRALDAVFDAQQIPLQVFDDREVRVPVSRMIAVFEGAACAVGERTFGYTVGARMSHRDFGRWMEYCAAAHTLGAALRRTAKAVRIQQTGGHVSLTTAGHRAVWSYTPPDLGTFAMQHSDHFIGPMLRFMRSFLGPHWQPSGIELNYARDPVAGQLEDLLECPLHFERPGIGIVFDAADLSATNPRLADGQLARHITFSDLVAQEATAPVGEPLLSIFYILRLRLIDGKSDIDGAALMAGMSVRSLQRLLQAEGVSYRNLLDSARASRADSLLQESHLRLIDIALSLGYSDQAAFTRAFRRWAGQSPSQVRAARTLSADIDSPGDPRLSGYRLGILPSKAG